MPQAKVQRWSVLSVAGLVALAAPACAHRVIDRGTESGAGVKAEAASARSVYAPGGPLSPEAAPSADRLVNRRQQPSAVASKPEEIKPDSLDGSATPPVTPPDNNPLPKAEPKTLQAQPPLLPIGPKPSESPKNSPLARALQCFLDNHPEEAVRCLSDYEPRDQELLLRLLPIVARVERGSLTAVSLGGEQQTLLEVLQAIVADLRLSAPLVLDSLVFCKQVYGYGKYDPIGDRFRPGEVVKVYAEMRNLAERREDDLYVTAVGGVMEIRGPDCKVKWSHTFPITLDQSASPRTDHFLRFTLPIPPTLPPGFYTLRVQVVDQNTQRQAEQSVGFRVTSLASPRVD